MQTPMTTGISTLRMMGTTGTVEAEMNTSMSKRGIQTHGQVVLSMMSDTLSLTKNGLIGMTTVMCHRLMQNHPPGTLLYMMAEVPSLTIGQRKRLGWTTVVGWLRRPIGITNKNGTGIPVNTRVLKISKVILAGILAAEAKDGMSRMCGMTLRTRKIVPRLKIAPGSLLHHGSRLDAVNLIRTIETVNEIITQAATRKAGSEVHL
jgi:hypothetical protein